MFRCRQSRESHSRLLIDRIELLDLDNLSSEDNALFNVAALETRRPFDALVEAVSHEHANNIDWIVSSIAGRNKYQSPLFIRCCRLVFLNKRLARTSERLEIRVADRALADVIRQRVAREYPNVSVFCTETIAGRIRRLLRPLSQLVIAVATLALRYAGRARPPVPQNQPITLIDTFVLNTASRDEGSIANGVYKDRYFPGLLDALTPEERRNIYFLPTIIGFRNPIAALRQIRSSSTAFIIHDDYLALSDYLYVLGSPFRLLRLAIPDVSFEGFAVGPMLREERRRNCSELAGLWGVLYFRFARQLAKAGVRVRVLVDWHENQPIDRGMIVGFHRFHPKTRIIGYQGYVIAKELHIYTHPTRSEIRGGAVPDVLTVTGAALQDDLREFAPELNVGVAPGFRFQKLWRERKFVPDPGTYTVLVGLPIDLGDAGHILRLLSSDARLAANSALSVRVKPHPTSSPDQIRALLPDGQFPDGWRFVTGDFHDVLEAANVLIGNASSTCLEALAKGVPVIVIAPATGIVQNVIPDSIDRDMWAICRNANEVIEVIERFRRLGADRFSEFERKGRDIREAYFSPVSRQSVLRFLALDGAPT